MLPDVPALWSYSSLKAVETCPRRYVLSRATYTDLWDRTGYPEVPSPAALFGDVVHDSLEAIVRALAAQGCTSASGPEAISVLRELGGYSEVAKAMLAKRLARLDDNPRLAGGGRERLQDQLEHRIPEAREEVQHYLHRMTLVPRQSAGSGPNSRGASPRYARGVGSHPEATLQADELRAWGRIDLLTVRPVQVDITDYKTGAEDESHFDQLRFYAVLWDQDNVSNSSRTPLGTLTASYPSREVTIEAPDAAQVQTLAQQLSARVTTADELVQSDEPAARPGDHCAFCAVRPLCTAYWPTTPEPASLKRGSWFDFEGTVVERNGIKSWWLHDLGPRKGPLLLRTTSAHHAFEPGQRLRLLGLRRDEDPDSEVAVAVLAQTSEVFLVTGESDY
ncbi:PD-(D/E)XK nuclease superfamily protein [Ornithinibacter aureus]|nr:PD-(D/E)XK nuclease superfamily protein [Ornithinibacter aureus]